MGNNINKLFVYGSLRKGFHHPAYEYISKHFTFIAVAKVKGKLYDLGEFPAAIATDEELFIKGEKGTGTGFASACLIFFRIFSFEEESFITSLKQI